MLRLGNGTVASLSDYSPQALLLQEISGATGLVKQNITVPTYAFGTQAACTLTGSSYAYEGFLSVSQDQRVLMWGCYAVPPGATGPGGYLSSALRVIARLFANGVVDTSLVLNDGSCAWPNVISSVVSVDGVSGFWIACSPFFSSNAATSTPAVAGVTGGVRYFNASSGTTTLLYSTLPVRSLTIFNNGLYASVSTGLACGMSNTVIMPC